MHWIDLSMRSGNVKWLIGLKDLQRKVSILCIVSLLLQKFSELGILFKSRVQPLVIAASSDEKKDLHSVDDIFENYVRDCTLLFTKEEDYVFIMDSSHG